MRKYLSKEVDRATQNESTQSREENCRTESRNSQQNPYVVVKPSTHNTTLCGVRTLS